MDDAGYDPYEISVEASESWMSRPIKVNLTSVRNARQANTQTFYLDVAEAYDLAQRVYKAAAVLVPAQEDTK